MLPFWQSVSHLPPWKFTILQEKLGKTRHFCKFQKDNSWPRNCGRPFPSCWSKRNMTDARGIILQWGIGEPTPHARAEQNKISWTRTATEKSKSEIASVLRLPSNPRRCIEDFLTSSFHMIIHPIFKALHSSNASVQGAPSSSSSSPSWQLLSSPAMRSTGKCE